MLYKIKFNLLHIALLLFILFFDISNAQKIANEYEIKTAWIGKFCQFVEWPPNCDISNSAKPFRIVVVGKHNFGNLLDEFYAEKKIKTKSVQITYIKDAKNLPDCDLVYITSSVSNNLTEIINRYQNLLVLTISDTKGFAEMGVHINMYKQNDMIRFEINEGAVKASNLQMSHLILRQAKIVTGDNK